MKNILMLLFFLLIGSVLIAQNNPIFGGGNADGVDKISFAQANNNIFNGGSGDGWDKTSFSQTVNNIFNGGSGDGWDKTAFAQALNNIFNGGSGDGWDKTAFAQALNNIYNGGNGDGWDKTAFAQAGNNIFVGGEGDGWASAYRPLGPLPITLISFTAQKQVTTVLLNWQTASAINFSHFDVERSSNAVQFTKIGMVNATGTSASNNYNFTDNIPLNDYNYYRLKLTDLNGSFKYTPVRVVNFSGKINQVNVFPNPATSKLQVMLTNEMLKENMSLNIINAAGQVVYHQKLLANGQQLITIDVSNLAAANYYIHLKGTTVNAVATIIKQ